MSKIIRFPLVIRSSILCLNTVFSKPNSRFISSRSTIFLPRPSKRNFNQKWIFNTQSIQYSNDSKKNFQNQESELTSNSDQKKLILTIPNLLTSLRIASVPFINYYFFIGQHDVACGLFVLASFTDFLDGHIARNFPNQLSHLGSILDPLADKLLIGKS